MARVIDNVLVNGVSGLVSNQLLLKTWKNGKTFLYTKPRPPRKESKLQKENRNKFREATWFAKRMMDNPEKKAEYAEIARKLDLPNAYTAAITEYMRRPEISEPEVVADAGSENEEIKVKVRKKDFELASLEIGIKDLSGKWIEKGNGEKGLSHFWTYKTNPPIENKVSLFIVVIAKDRAGNTYIKEFPYRLKYGE